MYNFFVDDKFYSEIEDYLIDAEIDEDNIGEVSDQWEQEIFLSKKEKLVDMNKDFVADAICNATERFDDRFPEDSDSIFEEIKNAVIRSVDFEKLNDLIPSLYYATGEKSKLTKKDLQEALK